MRLYFDCVLPFWVSIGVLSLCQGAVVALPRALVAGASGGPCDSALVGVGSGGLGDRIRGDRQRRGKRQRHALTYIALVAVPLLAALALGWLMHGARPASLALLAGRCSRWRGPTAVGWPGEGAAVGAVGAQLRGARRADRRA